MNEEHLKLIAKIQHFYDLMAQRLANYENESIASPNESDRHRAKAKAEEITTLLFEYSKVFHEFLYQEIN